MGVSSPLMLQTLTTLNAELLQRVDDSAIEQWLMIPFGSVRCEDGRVLVDGHLRESTLVRLDRPDRLGEANVPRADLAGETR